MKEENCTSNNQEMRLYFNFIIFIVQPLNDFNIMFQTDESRIGYLKDKITILLRKFMGKFVKAKVIQSAEDTTDVSFKEWVSASWQHHCHRSDNHSLHCGPCWWDHNINIEQVLYIHKEVLRVSDCQDAGKVSLQGSCGFKSFKPSKDILKTAKKACVGYNISCSSSQRLITPVSSENEKYFIKGLWLVI